MSKNPRKRKQRKKFDDDKDEDHITFVGRNKNSKNGFTFDSLVDLLKCSPYLHMLIFSESMLSVIRVGPNSWLVDFRARLTLRDAAMWIWMVEGDDSEDFPPAGYLSLEEASRNSSML